MNTTELDPLKYLDASHEEMAHMIERVAPWAERFQWKELILLTKYVSAYEAVKGEVIFSQGSQCNFVCFIATGQVEILKEAEDNPAKPLAILRPGRLVGEMAMIDGQPRSGAAMAKEDTIILIMTADSARSIANEHPRIALRLTIEIAKTISERLRQSSGKLIDLL